MSGERILIRGPALRVALIGAILASRWAGNGREVVLLPEQEDEADASVIARPDHLKVHGELGLGPDDLVQRLGAVPVLAYRAAAACGEMSLPFSPFGKARSGVEFHHYWQRASDVPDLFDFSLALRMHAVGRPVPLALLAQLQLQFGISLDRARYTDLLLKLAVSQGARVESSNSGEADLVIDCRSANGAPAWDGSVLSVAAGDDIAGLEWQACVNAARRLLGLMSSLSQSEAEQREYTRLACAEVERIDDFRALLNDPDPRDSSRPALKRKIDLFEACGRVPTEDFEVFAQPEWLAALRARGIVPRRFDRMANILSEQELRAWLADLQGKIATIMGERQPA